MRPAAVLLLSLAVSCSSVHDDLSQELLHADLPWLCDPGALGLPAEAFELDVGGGASLTGWFLPHAQAAGRTVVLCHGNDVNASMMHPYCSFLHDAGFNVVVFDYRGFGLSKGDATIRGAFFDTRELVHWLRARPDVDRDRIAWFGQSIGSLVALRIARAEGGCAALILEGVPSLRDALRLNPDGTEKASALEAGFREFASLPEGIEPDENAAAVHAPLLFLCGDQEPRRDLRSLLRTWMAAAGPKQLHVLPGTAPPPHALLTHDGQYQRRIVEFLASAFAGAPAGVGITSQKVAGNADAWQVTLSRLGTDDIATPWAVQVAAVAADASVSFHPVWLEGATTTATLRLPAAPATFGAMRVFDTVGTDDGAFAPQPSELTRAGRTWEGLRATIEAMRQGEPSPDDARLAAGQIAAATAAAPFHPLLEAELADVFAAIGRSLALAGGADREAGITWLRRAVAATPTEPKRHWWPGRPATFGFPQADAVARARKLLAELGG